MQNDLVYLGILHTTVQATATIRGRVIAQWSAFQFTYHTSYFPMSQPVAQVNLCALYQWTLGFAHRKAWRAPLYVHCYFMWNTIKNPLFPPTISWDLSVGCNSAQDLCSKLPNPSIFIYCELTKRYIQKRKKLLPAAFGHMYAAYLFFCLWLSNFSVPAFKTSHKIPLSMSWQIKVFRCIFSFRI